MTYTKSQLVKAMHLYLQDVIVNEDEYCENNDGTIGDAKRTVEKLIEFIE